MQAAHPQRVPLPSHVLKKSGPDCKRMTVRHSWDGNRAELWDDKIFGQTTQLVVVMRSWSCSNHPTTDDAVISIAERTCYHATFISYHRN